MTELMEQNFKTIKLSVTQDTIDISLPHPDGFSSLVSTYKISEMNDFDKYVVDLTLTAIAQKGGLNLVGYISSADASFIITRATVATYAGN
jgi:hypothetical protein